LGDSHLAEDVTQSVFILLADKAKSIGGGTPVVGWLYQVTHYACANVRKRERRLYLLREERVIAEYPVRLGLNPYGPKTREGDFRTPEGKYRLVKRNQNSDFFLSILLSYPSAEEAAVAKENGVEPGGQIMIHGQPNVPRRPLDFYASSDWTDGCIALSNSDMVDVWLRTGVGIPIEIRP